MAEPQSLTVDHDAYVAARAAIELSGTEAARETLNNAIADTINDFGEGHNLDWLLTILRDGFKGWDNMDDHELAVEIAEHFDADTIRDLFLPIDDE